MITDSLPVISKWADVKKLIEIDALSPAEHKLIKAAKAGGIANIGDAVPETKTDEALIRAPLLRYLILGGCEECSTEASGVHVQGAWIEGILDLDYVKTAGPVRIFYSHIAEQPQMMQMQAPLLSLRYSKLAKGMLAQGVRIAGDLQLTYVISEGSISVSGAKVLGQVDFLGVELTASKNVRDDPNSVYALNAQRLVAGGGFVWRKVKQVTGSVSFASSYMGDLFDDSESWEKCTDLVLVGLTYDILQSYLGPQKRLAWLQQGASPNGCFYPQPYEQLAKVLRESGHSSEAHEILFKKEVTQRKANRGRLLAGWHPFRWLLRLAWDWLLLLTMGFGHKPQRCFAVLVILSSLGYYVADKAWRTGDFAPNSDVILMSESWQALATNNEVENPAERWSARHLVPPVEQSEDVYSVGRDYETFNAVYYAVDIAIPIISLGQEAAWAPSTNRGVWGQRLFWLRYWLTAAGWIVTAIGAAAVTGVIQRD